MRSFSVCKYLQLITKCAFNVCSVGWIHKIKQYQNCIQTLNVKVSVMKTVSLKTNHISITNYRCAHAAPGTAIPL